MTRPTNRFGVDDIRWWATQKPPKRITRSTLYHEPQRMVTNYWRRRLVAEDSLRTVQYQPSQVAAMIAEGHKGHKDSNQQKHYMPVILKGRLLS